MLVLQARTGSPIAEDQIIGLFSEERKGFTLKVGRGEFNYWASLVNDEGSVMLNTSRRVTKALDASLEGVTDKAERLSTVHKALDQCTVIEIEAVDVDGNPKYDEQGQRIKRYILSVQGEAGLTEGAVNASIAKAATFSLKNAMSNRV